MKYWITCLIIGLVSLVSCKSTKYVTIPEYRTQYVCRTDTITKLDSVLVKDSVFVYHNRDTVFVNKIAYRDRWHNIYKVKSDTIFKRDSISVPYPVSRELTKNEQRLMMLGRVFITFLFVVVAAMILAIFWYKNKKS